MWFVLTFEDHMRGIVSCVSRSENWYFEVGEACLCGHLSVTSLLLCICLTNPWVLFSGVMVSCWMLSLASRALGVFGDRLPWSEIVIVPSKSFCLTVCTIYKVIRTRIIVCSVSFHMLLWKFDILELRPQLIHLSSKYQGAERSNLQGVSCRSRFVFGKTLFTLCLGP